MSSGYFGPEGRQTLGISALQHGLITATHILHRHGLLDAFGHISVRNADDPTRSFLLAQNISSALVSSAADLIEYKIENGEPVDAEEKREGYTERYIHSEIYKRFPGINCVVHSHAADVLPYCVSGVPLKPMVHTAGFLGAEVPLWDTYDTSHDLLIRTPKLAASLSAAFRPATSAAFIYNTVRSAISSIGGSQGKGSNSSSSDNADQVPEHAVVLMRGHGFVTAAVGIEEAVYQAIYTAEAARVQTAAMSVRAAYTGEKGTVKGKVDRESGSIQSGKVELEGKEPGLRYLAAKETAAAGDVVGLVCKRAWDLWCREVQVSPLYRNEVKLDE